jgi:hypothetical protein
MESSSVYDNRRKSSCATIVPPNHSKYLARKASLAPLKINTAGAKNLFYDTGSMTETSPTTVVSYKEEQGQSNQKPDKTWVQRLKQKLRLNELTKNDKNNNYSKTVNAQQKQHQHNNQSSRVVRHSYSDPRLSPGSTAVGDDDDDEEQQGYFSTVPTKKTKRNSRGWMATILMIVFGVLIAITFVLVGLGKALSGNNNIASVQNNSTITNATTTSASSIVQDKSSSLDLPTVTTSLLINQTLIAETVLTVTKSVTLVHKPIVTSS